MTALLSAKALGIGYVHGQTQRQIATDITFDINAGEAIAILGPNGCGKTTLLRTVLGLLPTVSGEIELQTQNIKTLTARLIAQRIGYVQQASVGLFHFNVLEIVLMGRAASLAWYDKPSQEDVEIAMNALSRLHIASFAEREFAELSSGERQLVLIARALATNAKLLLLDEPTTSLDFGNRLIVQSAVIALKAHGIGIMLTTHDPIEAARFCANAGDQILSIARHGATELGTTAKMLTPARLAALYGVNEAEIEAEIPILSAHSEK